MKCEICKKEVSPKRNSVVCSDSCEEIRKGIFTLTDKYFPTHGCENCWGDLHQRCTDQCRKELRESLAFGKDLWALVRLIIKKR